MSCSSPKTTGIPPVISALTSENASSRELQLESLWIGFSKALGISYRPGTGKTEDEFKAELNSYPGALGDDSFENLTSDLVKGFTVSSAEGSSPVYGTRCAKIERITALSGIAPFKTEENEAGEDTKIVLSNVKLYKFEYILQSENPAQAVTNSQAHSTTIFSPAYLTSDSQKESINAGDQIVRTALLSIPQKITGEENKKVPLIIYGHGGDDGMSYEELSRVFGELQNRYVIAAPSFPNEPLCEKRINPFTGKCQGQTIGQPVGISKPFDTDANEILGLHDCIARSTLTESSEVKLKDLGLAAPYYEADQNKSESESSATLNTLLSSTLKRYGDGASPDFGGPIFTQGQPVSILVGSSRGAATGLAALAKAGAALRGFSQNEGKILLSRFQCGAFLFPPTTFAMGELRVGLELFIKGLADSTSFYRLPGADELANFFKDYREGNMSTAETVSRYSRIDPLLSSHLIAVSLRDWSSESASAPTKAGQGKLLFIHGQNDQVVNSEQSRFFGSFIGKASHRVAALGWAPGIDSSIISFKAPSRSPFPTENPLANLGYQHGDSVFYNSTQVADADPNLEYGGWNIAQNSGYPENYNQEFMNRTGPTPQVVFEDWLANECNRSLE